MGKPRASGPMIRGYMHESLDPNRDPLTGEVVATHLAEDAIWHFDLDPQSELEGHLCEMCYDWAEEIVRGDNCRRTGAMPGCVASIVNRRSSTEL